MPIAVAGGVLACLVSLSLVPAFGSVTVNSPEKGFYGSEWQKKNTLRGSIDISLKLYFNIKVKGDFNISTKISTDRVA